MYQKGMFKTILSRLFARNVYADGAVTAVTPEGVTNGGTLFSDAVRAVYSKEIEFKALPNMRFFQFASIRTELGTEPGLTISMLTYDNLALGGALQELKAIETQALSGSLKQIIVTEYGNGVSFSEKAIQSSFDDLLSRATTLLGRDYSLVVDTELRDTALGGTNIVYADKADGTHNAARTDLDAGSTLKVSTIKDALEILSTNNAPKYNGQYWIAFIHPHQSRKLRDDPSWINASNYGDPTLRFTGEIGRIDDTIFIESTILSNGAAAADDVGYEADLKAGTAGNKVNVFKSVVFGDAYYGIAFGLPVELRDDGIKDFGRVRSLAWYAIFGVGRLHDQYGVVIETA